LLNGGGMRPAHGLASLPALALVATLGTAAGLSGYAFVYARGSSYLTDDPAACNNCHVMRAQYDGWRNGPHHAAATCNDCHTPSAPFAKYLVKALNGWHHSTAFTSGAFKDVITLRASSREVVEGQCKTCHADLVAAMEGGGEVSCIRCHDSVGHLR
jgi:cytochrome c nitrite reductase small subunit